MGYITRVKTWVAEKLYFSHLNTEFNNILSGLSDGTKDVNVAATTVNGTLLGKGDVTLGTAVANTITLLGNVNATATNIAVNVVTANVAEIAAGNVTANFTGNTAGIHTGNVIATLANITTANIGTAVIGATDAASANVMAAARTRTVTTDGTDPGAGGVCITGSSGAWSTNSISFANITNLSGTITTSGRPVMIRLVGDAAQVNVGLATDALNTVPGTALLLLQRDGANIAFHKVEIDAGGKIIIPLSSVLWLDTPNAGTYVYTVQGAVYYASNTVRLYVSYSKLVIYEL